VKLDEDTLVIGLGGNVGGDEAIVQRFEHARGALQELGDRIVAAGLYRTAAILEEGKPGQDDYLNSAVRIRVDEGVTADQIFQTVMELERMLGRDRRGEARWAPRTIDLDVILWGTRAFRTPQLEIPHPRWGERRFVVQPLMDLFGEEAVIHGAKLVTLARLLVDQRLELVKTRW
jgi:2-amino-4-hydroxy-6-hydroxymethyldihydropteridine diphosphokinase